MVAAVAEYFSIALGDYDVAHLAYEIERSDCAMAGGKQDQYAAAFGGFNFMEFGANERVIVNPLRIKPEIVNELESSLLLYYTGTSRESAAIIRAQIASAERDETDALQAMHAIRDTAVAMKEALLTGDVPGVIGMLGRSWASKKRLAPGVSNAFVDRIAAAAMDAGASAVKISGAGGGGFMMIGVHPTRRYSVVSALAAEGGHFFPFRFVNEGVESWKSN
jgi:D-glycero-alpha-D-manno-heptose-7-phosphate kinase